MPGASIRGLVWQLVAILNAAVADERIVRHPCPRGTLKLPTVPSRKVVPWTDAQVVALRRELPDRYAVLIALITGLGLRQAEAFGLAVEDIDFMKQTVRVQRQVKIVRSRLAYDLPKGRKVRDVPLPSSVAMILSAYIQTFPPRPVTLPWETGDGRPVSARLLVTSREGGALNRNYLNKEVWKTALAGVPLERQNMMHGGRHYYASVQLEAGTSIRALADYLGHSDAGFTLRVYPHLMPQAEDKAKKAVDDAFDRLGNVPISLLSGPNVAQASP